MRRGTAVELIHARRQAIEIAVMAAYGTVLAFFLAAHLVSWLPQQRYEGSREIYVRLSIEALAKGAPPLTGITVTEDGTQKPYPLFTADDEGIYLYLPAIAHVLGISEPKVAHSIFAFGLLVPVILLYPLVIYALFDSILAAFVAPLALLVRFGFFLEHDIYWVPAWTLLACLPFVYAAHRHWSGKAIVTLAIVLAVASIASSIRSHAGLPILISVIGLALAKERRWPMRAWLVAGFLVVYFAVGPGSLSAARQYRDLTYGTDWSSSVPAAHPFWHPVYLGLSYLPNPYGITWNDSVAAKAVEDEDPSIDYVSSAYENTLRRLYLRILEKDPGFVFATYAAKGIALWDDLMSADLPLLFLAILGMALPPRRAQMRGLMLLTTPALVLAAVPPLLTIPDGSFERAWFAAGAMIWVLGLAWGLALARPWVASVPRAAALRAQGRKLLAFGSLPRLVHSLLLCLVAGGLMIFALGAVDENRHRLQAIGSYSQASALKPSDPSGVVLETWSLRSGLPSEWWLNPKASVRTTSDGTTLLTSAEKFNYQVTSPEIAIAPGKYQLSLRGKPRSGGITVGVLDAARGVWLTTSNYFAGQRGFETGAMAASFETTKPLRIVLIFANWNVDGDPSEWELQQADLRFLSDRP